MTDIDDETSQASTFLDEAIAAESWCHVFTFRPGSGLSYPFAMGDIHGRVTRRLRGHRMRTSSQLDDEFDAVWQFGDYSGPSYGAFFHDSMGDLHLTWPTSTGFILIVSEPDQVLADEPSAPSTWTPMRALVQELAEAAEWYAEDEGRDPEDPLFRGPLSFDVVLVTDAEHRDEVVRRWHEAGAPVGD